MNLYIQSMIAYGTRDEEEILKAIEYTEIYYKHNKISTDTYNACIRDYHRLLQEIKDEDNRAD